MPASSLLNRLKSVSGSKTDIEREYNTQAERLGQYASSQESDTDDSTRAVEARFVTPQDPVIETANGGRLPAVPLDEAVKLNKLKDTLEGRDQSANIPVKSGTREAKDGTIHGARPSDVSSSNQSAEPGAPLRQAVPNSRTNPLFPPLPMYGPPSAMRIVHCWFFRTTSFFLSFAFLIIIVLGSAATSLPLMFTHIGIRLRGGVPDARRPFYAEEQKRKRLRRQKEKAWDKKCHHSGTDSPSTLERNQEKLVYDDEFVPTEGGKDPLVADVAYYARRVGLDIETFDVQTEDGFILELHHIFNPREDRSQPEGARSARGPDAFQDTSTESWHGETEQHLPEGRKKYPILMIHGLLQSAGAYCCTDEDSLAFYLAKSGYDVWLGNNRCGFKARHQMLRYSDPRMWAWNIRQMGVLDLPALISRVLSETGFPKLGLVAHSQGTTQTLVALAKEQRPDLGDKISVFCALAPAAYAGPLIGKAYFKFMRIITPSLFRCVFGIHAFIPFMMTMHKVLPGPLYGAMGYRVFSFLFNWSDTRWDMDIRDRMFQFAPVYVSAESMRWWLGRECFATQKCILATREEGRMEDEEDEEEDHIVRQYYENGAVTDSEKHDPSKDLDRDRNAQVEPDFRPGANKDEERGRFAWYNEQFPPLALWVCGNDDLVDGRRLLRRFDRGREPYVNVVHKKIIEGYEHLDVIWAMDCVDKVGKEIKEVVWKTADEESRRICRTPKGCQFVFDHEQAADREDTGSRPNDNTNGHTNVAFKKVDGPVSPTQIDATAGEWTDELREDARTSVEDAQSSRT